MYNFAAESSDFVVIWTWHHKKKKQPWDVDSNADTINSRLSHLSNWFRVKHATRDKYGRLALHTTTASHTFGSLSSLETAMRSFLEKFLEVCDLTKFLEEVQLIKLSVTNYIDKKGT